MLNPDNRRHIAASGTVVWLRARPQTLAARVGDGAGRPLLDDDPAAALVDLNAVRAPLYAEVADIVIDVDDLSPAEVAERILADSRGTGSGHRGTSQNEADVHALSVDLAERSYPSWSGRARATRWPGSCRRMRSRAAIVTQQAIVDAGWLDGSRPRACRSEICIIPDGEDAKTLATVEDLARRFARAGLSRADVVVAVGGGIVTDVAGFAAATYHRGTAYVNVATTLLAQVDAAIGGKTGVNLPEGKNLVGAFWQPDAVLCDTETLSIAAAARVGVRPRRDRQVRLPRRRAHGRPAHRGAGGALCRASRRRSCREDEREGGRRMVLNYGHTLAPRARGARRMADHHGGTCATARRWPSGSSSPRCWPSGSAASTTRAGRRAPRRSSGASTSRPTCRPDADAEELVTFMGRDKKAQQDLTFVLDGPDGVEPVRAWPLPTWSLPWLPWVRAREPRPRSSRGRTSTCSASASPRSTGPPRWPTTWHAGRSGRRHVTAWSSSTCQSNHEGELIEAVHGARGRAPMRWWSTPARSATRRGRSTTPWPPSTDRSSSCTSRTRPRASPSGTPRCWPRSPTGSIAGLRRPRLRARRRRRRRAAAGHGHPSNHEHRDRRTP